MWVCLSVKLPTIVLLRNSERTDCMQAGFEFSFYLVAVNGLQRMLLRAEELPG